MIRVLSMNFDGTYVINAMRDMRDADKHAKTYVNQLHFISMRSMNGILQWVGEELDCTCWSPPINLEQAKKAQLLFTLEPT